MKAVTDDGVHDGEMVTVTVDLSRLGILEKRAFQFSMTKYLSWV